MIDADILADFQTESKAILQELTEVVEKLEDSDGDFPTTELQTFSQRIDRIMGAAKTMLMMDSQHQGMQRIAGIAEICKQLGYKAAEAKASDLIPIFAAFWADTIDVMTELVDCVEDATECARISHSSAQVLQNRLQWLAQKINTGQTQTASQIDVDALLQQFKS